MPIYCFVPGCTTTGTNGLHRFPADPERKTQWMKNTNTLDLQPTENAKVCRKHFKESDLLIDLDGKKRLAPNAVPIPSLCLPLTPLTLDWGHNYHLV